MGSADDRENRLDPTGGKWLLRRNRRSHRGCTYRNQCDCNLHSGISDFGRRTKKAVVSEQQPTSLIADSRLPCGNYLGAGSSLLHLCHRPPTPTLRTCSGPSNLDRMKLLPPTDAEIRAKLQPVRTFLALCLIGGLLNLMRNAVYGIPLLPIRTGLVPLITLSLLGACYYVGVESWLLIRKARGG